MTECTKGTEPMRDQLPLLAQGALGATDATRLRAHIAECPACAAELEIIDAALKVFALATPTVDRAAIQSAIPQPKAVPAAAMLRLMPRSRPMSRGGGVAASRGRDFRAGGPWLLLPD
jgi:anti-sigma factor RsiW